MSSFFRPKKLSSLFTFLWQILLPEKHAAVKLRSPQKNFSQWFSSAVLFFAVQKILLRKKYFSPRLIFSNEVLQSEMKINAIKARFHEGLKRCAFPGFFFRGGIFSRGNLLLFHG